MEEKWVTGPDTLPPTAAVLLVRVRGSSTAAISHLPLPNRSYPNTPHPSTSHSTTSTALLSTTSPSSLLVPLGCLPLSDVCSDYHPRSAGVAEDTALPPHRRHCAGLRCRVAAGPHPSVQHDTLTASNPHNTTIHLNVSRPIPTHCSISHQLSHLTSAHLLVNAQQLLQLQPDVHCDRLLEHDVPGYPCMILCLLM